MSCCGNKNQEKQYSAESPSAVCPVMGNPVDKKKAEEKGLVREYDGKKHYFCCNGCPEKFDQNPENYI